MPLIEILDVCHSEQANGPLWGCHVDKPDCGALFDGGVFDTWGWVLGRTSPAVAVEFVDRVRVIHRVPVNGRRPDLQRAFPHVRGADQGGFRTTLAVTGPVAEFRIEVLAVLKDRARVPMGVLLARRRWREDRNAAGSPLVSVIIPCYRQAHYLGEAIESVHAQTYPHVEVVVIDDGSPDNTLEVAMRYPGVRCIRQDNQGLAAARNTGIRRSNGSYLVFLDADDRLAPGALETGLRMLESHPGAAFTAGRYRSIGWDGSPQPTPEHGCAEADHYAALLRSNYIGMPATIMYRREVFESIPGFDPSLPAASDYELSLGIVREFPICCHDEVVAEYRQRGASMSRDPALMLWSVLRVLEAQRKHVRCSVEYRLAYRAGIEFWKRYYGRPLAHDTANFARRGEWRRLLRAAWLLLRCYPAGLVSVLRGSATLD